MIGIQNTPFVVEVIKAPTRETSVYDVLVGSVGLIGVIVLFMVIVGVLFGGLFIWIRRRREARKTENVPEGVQLHLNAP